MTGSRRLLGQATRGKTAPNRLRKTDTFLAVAYPELVRHMPGLYVDLGYGFFPITSVETRLRLGRLNPALQVLGVEIDPERVAGAAPFASEGLSFRLGGFNLPLLAGEQVSVVRAFNVLRQYTEAAVAEALTALAAPLTPGGLILEGTSDPLGRLLTFNLYQKQGAELTRTALVLAPSLHAGFLPRQFQAVLPKNFIHHAEPGGPIDGFFGAWHAAWQRARAEAADPRQVFARAARRLAEHYGYTLDQRPALLRRGFLALGANWPETQRPG
ncbi:MAG: hypothetical protein IT317_24375 [Anaerolineales bacterium]|nr:hypothetical protein [Anaerolineales bacterium]